MPPAKGIKLVISGSSGACMYFTNGLGMDWSDWGWLLLTPSGHLGVLDYVYV